MSDSEFFKMLSSETKQRSHRFPLDLYACIVAISKDNKVPFSRVVNALLVEGIRAVNKSESSNTRI